MKVLVTGASGFTGMQMVQHLATDSSVTLFALTHHPVIRGQFPDPITSLNAELTDPVQIAEAIRSARPDAIIHLAALNRGSLEDLLATNVNGTRNLLEAALIVNPACRILVVSSSAVYGYAGKKPVTESTCLNPLTDYGVSKAAQEHLALMYHVTRGTQVVIARPFNLIGPSLPDSLVCGKIVRQIVEIEQGRRDAFDLMETVSSRDFIDVRDVVKAYWAILNHSDFTRKCAGKVFNVGSGTARTVQDILEEIQDTTGKPCRIRLPEKSPELILPFQQADIGRIRKTSGWSPQIPFRASLRDMLTAARSGQSQ
jgi:GDP-4-dehydro-6-deoxy-D-mannose reductase